MILRYKKINGFRFLRIGRVSVQYVWCKRAPHDADRAPLIPIGDLIVAAIGFNALTWFIVVAQIIARRRA